MYLRVKNGNLRFIVVQHLRCTPNIIVVAVPVSVFLMPMQSIGILDFLECLFLNHSCVREFKHLLAESRTSITVTYLIGSIANSANCVEMKRG